MDLGTSRWSGDERTSGLVIALVIAARSLFLFAIELRPLSHHERLVPLDSNGQPFSLAPQTVEHIIEREGNESAAWNLCGRNCAVLATDWWSLARH